MTNRVLSTVFLMAAASISKNGINGNNGNDGFPRTGIAHGFVPPLPTTLSARVGSRRKLSPSDDPLFFLISSDAIVAAAADVVSTAADATTAANGVVADVATTTTDGAEASSFMPSYSKASYYTTLALYVASFPGLWSQIKRSTKAKIKRKTYVRWGARG